MTYQTFNVKKKLEHPLGRGIMPLVFAINSRIKALAQGKVRCPQKRSAFRSGNPRGGSVSGLKFDP